MAQTILGFTWFTDGVKFPEPDMLRDLASLAHSVPTAAERLLSFPWMADKITEYEVRTVQYIETVADESPSLAELLTRLPSIADDITREEWRALRSIGDSAKAYPSLAERLVGLPWIADGMTGDEERAAGYILDLAKQSSSLAELLVGLPWIADGITASEMASVRYLKSIAEIDPEIATSLLNIPGEVGDLAGGVLRSVNAIAGADLGLLQQLLTQPWYQDGLSDEEAALIVVLRSTAHQEDVFRALIEGGKVISDTFSLPLTGEVNSYVVSRFPLQEDVLGYIRTGMGAIEDFMGLPWTPHMIALVEPEWDDPFGRGVRGAYIGSHFVGKSSGRHLVYHEMAHYYFNGMSPWLDEGGANFLESYVLYANAQTGHYSPEYHQHLLQIRAIPNCAKNGASNIQEWIDAPEEKKIRSKLGHGPLALCHYALGTSFLLGMYESLGHDAVMASLRQLYEARRERGVTEDAIYETFLSNAPPAKQDEFRDLYSCLHGRPIPGYTPAARVTPTHVRDALVALYNATNGPDWKSSENWLSEAPISQWHGVSTYCDGSVFLNLRDNNLSGPIPPELGNLSNLKALDLSRNQFTGTIPAELGNLSNLIQLWLHENKLSGPIPAELGGLSELEVLILARNQLTGTIPQELGNLTKLERLFLAGNQLTGCIPKDLQGKQYNDLKDTNLTFC